MIVVPVGEHVVVRGIEPEEPAEGELVLPGSATSWPRQGRVLSVGDGRRLACGSRTQPCVGEGDRVLYSSHAGQEVTLGGEKLLILTEAEILAVLE